MDGMAIDYLPVTYHDMTDGITGCLYRAGFRPGSEAGLLRALPDAQHAQQRTNRSLIILFVARCVLPVGRQV